MCQRVGSLNGLALVRRSEERTGSRILLVRFCGEGKSWELPESATGGTLAHLVEETKRKLFPTVQVDFASSLYKSFVTDTGERTYHLVVATAGADIAPHLQYQHTREARWSSFEEAFHIARLDLEKVLRWSEHHVEKVVVRTCRTAA
jgi:hypothetical protein